MIELSERISRYMERLDPAVSGQRGHKVTFRAAAILTSGFGLEPDEAFPFLRKWNERSMPPWDERQLRRKLRETLRSQGDNPRGYLLNGKLPRGFPRCSEAYVAPTKAVYSPEKLDRLSAKLPDVVDADYLEARSKFTCWNRSISGFLHKINRPGEKVLIFTEPRSQGAEIWEHPGIVGDLSNLDHFKVDCENGVWFMNQPVTGEFVELERLKSAGNPTGRSRRCEECVTAWRYAVVESDSAPQEKWLKALVQLPLRIAGICSSGGRSIHALVRVDAQSKAEWDETVRTGMRSVLVALGADPGSLTAVRLTRLPGCIREENGQEQKLLYLDDEPDGKPICEKEFYVE